jgi:hypothetical protein
MKHINVTFYTIIALVVIGASTINAENIAAEKHVEKLLMDSYLKKNINVVYIVSGDSTRNNKFALLRTNCKSAGFDNIFELCSYVEYNWKNTGGMWNENSKTPKDFTSDGTHPTCAGSEAIAEHAYLINVK